MPVTLIALSDSHATTTRQLPPQLLAALGKADIVVHAGDFTETSVLDELIATGKVVAVAGNMDSTALKLRLPQRQVVTVGGKTVGVVHGSGAPGGLPQRVRALFPEAPDLIIFGHSHVPFSGIIEGALMVNPGPAKDGYAVVTIGEQLTAKLVRTS